MAVGPQEVLGFTDNEFLEFGISTIGDKARLRQRCRLHTSEFTIANYLECLKTTPKRIYLHKGARCAFNRKSFKVERMLSVKFAGEYGMDDGGPRREFMRLALREIKDCIFEGEEKKYAQM
ncbi:uncharacterized protein LOC130013123 [Patella vulgata]|uniref:uncharacterized protein LOC130013123 n=1 Tax=Patella vulgata TaxID=6465 RepID=UPI0024A824C8|nr:uncharacterized protein LOC130013123 [Patella vulgata]